MIPRERAELYAKAYPEFPDSHFLVSDRWISATWMTGNNYHNPSGYYGSYPPGYLNRIASLFPDAKNVLHLFSGSLTREQVSNAMPNAGLILRADIRPEMEPDLLADAESLAEATKSTGIPGLRFNLILADPPYSVEDAEHYGPPLVNKKKVLEECHKVLEPGGTLAWMDQSVPMFKKEQWNWYGIISMYRSTNHRIRGVMLFEKK